MDVILELYFQDFSGFPLPLKPNAYGKNRVSKLILEIG